MLGVDLDGSRRVEVVTGLADDGEVPGQEQVDWSPGQRILNDSHGRHLRELQVGYNPTLGRRRRLW
jgi:hypothetical protein